MRRASKLARENTLLRRRLAQAEEAVARMRTELAEAREIQAEAHAELVELRRVDRVVALSLAMIRDARGDGDGLPVRGEDEGPAEVVYPLRSLEGDDDLVAAVIPFTARWVG